MDQVVREKKARIWQRDELDWYVEPIEATTALLQVERFTGYVLDPACGTGNIVRAFVAAGYGSKVYGSDIVRRVARPFPSWWVGESDFLADGLRSNNIVTNPPFFGGKGTESFIRRALAVTSGKVAIFTDIRFLAGGKRARGLWSEFPPHRVWIVTPRVSCPPGEYLANGGKAEGGSADWCWLIWDRTAPPATESRIGWLHVDKFAKATGAAA